MTASTTATRERILDEAMRLFGEHGFRGTSVAAIERAAGLTPGAGGLYHHFRSKDAVLALGLQRHLARLGALRDIRRLFAGVGDARVQLTLLARYVLAELDAGHELVRILLTESRNRPDLVGDAVTVLVEGTVTEFATWLEGEWGVSPARARPLSALALGALFSHRLLSSIGPGPAAVTDDDFVAAWAETFELAVRA